MAQQETYYYGQGKVKLAVIAADGSLGPWRWLMDVSALSAAIQEESVSHRESYSGKKAKVREFGISADMTLSATLRSMDTDNLALFTQGTATSTAAGSVTGEVLPSGLEAGDVVNLAQINVSDLVITDSAASPATLAAEHYSLEALYGSVEILSLPSAPAPTQPLKAAYSHGASKQVTFLTAAKRPNVALRYEGVNLAEGGAPVVMELYKLAPGLLQELAMITEGTEVAGLPVTFAALLDTSKPANGPLGQFGRIVQAV